MTISAHVVKTKNQALLGLFSMQREKNLQESESTQSTRASQAPVPSLTK